MQVKVSTLQAIIDLLVERTGCSPDYRGFKVMSKKMGLKNVNYVYAKMYRPTQHNPDGEIGLSPTIANSIAKFFKYKSFRELESDLKVVKPQVQALSMIGSYYGYVRANLSKPTLLRSPVQIYESTGKVWFELQDADVRYKGELMLQGGCMSVQMTSKDGRVLFHVYKIGKRHGPGVLQGVFSGVSSAFEPIGGRVVLVRQDDDGKKLKNEAIDMGRMKESKVKGDRILAKYFWKWENNGVVAGEAVSFGFEDLE